MKKNILALLLLVFTVSAAFAAEPKSSFAVIKSIATTQGSSTISVVVDWSCNGQSGSAVSVSVALGDNPTRNNITIYNAVDAYIDGQMSEDCRLTIY